MGNMMMMMMSIGPAAWQRLRNLLLFHGCVLCYKELFCAIAAAFSTSCCSLQVIHKSAKPFTVR
jgi:hypothetical protein